MRISTLLAASVLAFAAVPAHAATWIFSYDFGSAAPGSTVNGSFTGDGPATGITNIDNISLFINSTKIDGVSAYSYTGYNGPSGPNNTDPSNFPAGGAVVSSNPLLNNFIFSTAGFGKYFYIIPWSNGGSNQVAVQAKIGDGSYIPTNVYNGTFEPANFTISAAPEPASWLMMILGFGLVGGSLRRRRGRGKLVAA